MKTVWHSIKVKDYLDSGDITNAINFALEELSEMGYEPKFVTHVGVFYGVVVVVSGCMQVSDESHKETVEE